MPVPSSNRITVGVWVFINKTASMSTLVHIVVPDFMVISFKTNNNDIQIYCTMYQKSSSTATRTQDYIYTTNFPPSDSQFDINSIYTYYSIS